MTIHHPINFAGQWLHLLPSRSIYWETEKTLILSDLHMGKPAHFRKHGIAIPAGISDKDLSRLAGLIVVYSPERIIVVGDLLHDLPNLETDSFSHWLNQYSSIEWEIIKGNHDRYTLDISQRAPYVKFAEIHTVAGITFFHKPSDEYSHTISGHLHPGVKLRGQNVPTVTLPCFLVSEKQIVLPAFSEFTGLDTRWQQQPGQEYRVFGIAGEKI